jgi:hypothetical protein
VSVGALTHSAPAADLSFEIRPNQPLLTRSPTRWRRRGRGWVRSASVSLVRRHRFDQRPRVGVGRSRRGRGVRGARRRAIGGRGRLGRTWASPAGAGIYVSVVLRPAAQAMPLLTMRRRPRACPRASRPPRACRRT